METKSSGIDEPIKNNSTKTPESVRDKWKRRLRIINHVPILATAVAVVAGCLGDFENIPIDPNESPNDTADQRGVIPTENQELNSKSMSKYFSPGQPGLTYLLNFLAKNGSMETAPAPQIIEDEIIRVAIEIDPNLSVPDTEMLIAAFASEAQNRQHHNLHDTLLTIRGNVSRGDYANRIIAHKRNLGIEPQENVQKDTNHLNEWINTLFPETIDKTDPSKNRYYDGDYIELMQRLPSPDEPGLDPRLFSILTTIKEETDVLLKRDRASTLINRSPRDQYVDRHAEMYGLVDPYNSLVKIKIETVFPDQESQQRFYNSRIDLYENWLEANNLYLNLIRIQREIDDLQVKLQSARGNEIQHYEESIANLERQRDTVSSNLSYAARIYHDSLHSAQEIFPTLLAGPNQENTISRADIEEELRRLKEELRRLYDSRLGKKTGESAMEILGGEYNSQGVRLVLAPQRNSSS